MKNFIRATSLMLLITGSSAVMATPTSGSIGFFGVSVVTGTNLSFSFATVALADGSFAADGISSPDAVTFTSFDYATDPFVTIDPLWTIGDYAFSLESVVVGPTGPGVDLALSGTGILTHESTDTVYNWTYSGNAFAASTTQTFSSASSTPVPVPGSLALLGLGLLGLITAGYGRRRT